MVSIKIHVRHNSSVYKINTTVRRNIILVSASVNIAVKQPTDDYIPETKTLAVSFTGFETFTNVEIEQILNTLA